MKIFDLVVWVFVIVYCLFCAITWTIDKYVKKGWKIFVWICCLLIIVALTLQIWVIK